ncbi:MAG: hypothetical protein FJZ01_21960 [Candidatus Sericytochromatia bacterium]|nr:hypothetical protein [Candidatus Tanganyikabacteria bacterium]
MPAVLSVEVRPDESFERYEALAREHGSDRVLALVARSTRTAWLRRLEGVDRAEDLIFTPGAWVRRELALWWPLADAGLTADGWPRSDSALAEPLFVQADIAQGLMAAFTRESRQRDRAFADARTPSSLIYVQLLDVLDAAVLHRLDLAEAARLLLAGCFYPDEAPRRRHVQPCLEAYRDGMLRARMLDRSLARWVFELYVLPSEPYLAHRARTLRAELREDPPAAPSGPLGRLAFAILADSPAGLPLGISRTYPEMLGRASAEAVAGFAAGRTVALVVPGMTSLLAWWFRRALAEAGVPLVVSAGTNRLTDHAPVRVALALAAHAFPVAGGPERDPDLWQDALEAVDGDAGRIEAWADAARALPLSLAGVFRLAFGRLLAPAGRTAADWQVADAISQLASAAERFAAADARMEGAWGRPGDGAPGLAGQAWRFREFLLAGHFAARPGLVAPPPAGAVRLTTLRRFAEDGEAADLVLLLDASAPSWLRSGAREICNANVLRPDRPAGPYLPAEEREDAIRALASDLSRAAAWAQGEAHLLASLADAEGGDQPGGLADFCEPSWAPEPREAGGPA